MSNTSSKKTQEIKTTSKTIELRGVVKGHVHNMLDELYTLNLDTHKHVHLIH
jgi:hypothetical protein